MNSTSTNLSPCSVVLGVLTFKRPKELARLLASLSPAVALALQSNVLVRLLISDNDPSGSACEIVHASSLFEKIPIEIKIVKNPGIAFARNEVLESLTPEDDFLIFVDDDEVVSEDWVLAMVSGIQRHQADAAAGHVEFELEENVEIPPWLPLKELMNRKIFSEGEKLATIGTGNTILRCESLRKFGGKFDVRFALTGGEDSLFFYYFTAAGFTLVYLADAGVTEFCPANRATTQWLVRRSFRLGNTIAKCDLSMGRPFILIPRRLIKASGLFLLSFFGLLFLVFFNKKKMIISLCGISRSLGMLFGLLGGHWQEYKRS